MRKTLALLIGLATMVAFTMLVGCVRESERPDKTYVKYNANIFDSSQIQRIYIDKETGVQYIIFGSGNGQCMSVRLDADGKPMVDGSVRK